MILPVRRLYGELSEGAGRVRPVPFLIRADIHSPSDDYNPAIAAEAAHEEAFARLHGWMPAAFARGRAMEPMYRETSPQSLPLWDDDLGVWFLSAEYRAVLAPV